MKAVIGFQTGISIPGTGSGTGGDVVIGGDGYQYGDSNGTYYGFFKEDGSWIIKKIDVDGMSVTRTYALSTDNPGIPDYATAWAQRESFSYV